MSYARLFASLLILSSFAAGAVAAPRVIETKGGPSFAVPSGATVQFQRFDGPFGSAMFVGRHTISGMYYYGRMAGFPGDHAIGVYFMPDADDAARLPYWPEEGAVKEMRFANPTAFIKAVIPARLADAVRRGRRNSVQGRATINADGFEATVLCGAAIYLTRFQSIARKPTLLADNGTRSRTTC